MSKIATEQEAYNIGKSGTPVTNKCCTYSRAVALGCNVTGSYTSNQLVQLENLHEQTNYVQYSGNVTGIKLAAATQGTTPTTYHHPIAGIRYNNTNYWIGLCPQEQASGTSRSWIYDDRIDYNLPKSVTSYKWIIGVCNTQVSSNYTGNCMFSNLRTGANAALYSTNISSNMTLYLTISIS